MSRFLALSVSQPAHVECSAAAFGGDLTFPASRAGGWGLGYYSAGEVLRRIEPRERGEELDAYAVLSELAADLVIMHTREATVGSVRRENTHPFRFGDWLFAHNGTIEGFADLMPALREAMPPFVLRNLVGDTDSEHLFHLFLSFLYDAGQIGRPDLGPEAICAAILRAVSMIDELGDSRAQSPLAAVTSDGYSLVAVSRGIPVDFAVVEGVIDCPVCRGSMRPDGATPAVDHPELRAVIVLSGEGAVTPEGFQRIPERSALLSNMKHGVNIVPLDG